MQYRFDLYHPELRYDTIKSINILDKVKSFSTYPDPAPKLAVSNRNSIAPSRLGSITFRSALSSS
jgi:hypothetical protein